MSSSTLRATRDGFGEALLQLGQQNPDVVVLTADLAESTRADKFGQRWPERFFEVGVAEQNLMGVASGLAVSGKVPFATSYAVFSPGRSWDQLRVSVCYNQANVKVVGCHAGLSVGPDGANHQALEDLAITRVLPNLTVLCPADAEEARKATLAAAAWQGPVYLRLGREPGPAVTEANSAFEIGQANILRAGQHVTLVACGGMVPLALQAADQLQAHNISAEVINLHTIKPIDSASLLKSVGKTGHLVTVEEHQLAGGMGSAVLEAIMPEISVPVRMVGVHDTFGESGKAAELWQKYGLTVEEVEKAVKQVLSY